MPKTLKQKQEEAEERRKAHEQRTPEDQMNLVERRPGSSTRERAKLLAIIERRGKVTR